MYIVDMYDEQIQRYFDLIPDIDKQTIDFHLSKYENGGTISDYLTARGLVSNITGCSPFYAMLVVGDWNKLQTNNINSLLI